MTKTVISASLVILLFIGFSLTMKYINMVNTEVQLRERVLAQQEAVKSNFDKTHKSITQVAQVPSEFMEQSKEAFKEIYPQLMEGRYSNERGGALMSWVKEHNPNFDMSAASKLYENLQITIESNRAEFDREQRKLIDINREHKTYINKFFQRIFLNAEEIEIIIITSTKTEEAFKNGIDDDINLFK